MYARALRLLKCVRTSCPLSDSQYKHGNDSLSQTTNKVNTSMFPRFCRIILKHAMRVFEILVFHIQHDWLYLTALKCLSAL